MSIILSYTLQADEDEDLVREIAEIGMCLRLKGFGLEDVRRLAQYYGHGDGGDGVDRYKNLIDLTQGNPSKLQAIFYKLRQGAIELQDLSAVPE